MGSSILIMGPSLYALSSACSQYTHPRRAHQHPHPPGPPHTLAEDLAAVIRHHHPHLAPDDVAMLVDMVQALVELGQRDRAQLVRVLGLLQQFVAEFERGDNERRAAVLRELAGGFMPHDVRTAAEAVLDDSEDGPQVADASHQQQQQQ
ncbi:uncharacterized protein LOC62_06G008255 [Vanrija pseudolonga]|uniref:Uncharacterized protein n=1 Tax=Vanrija pseudolonga TaxID=143232 RepID=A0AAF0YE66_9TREE|nr:hypothetical protein LOC62_06G008255 [Vanrija pseudolonga]